MKLYIKSIIVFAALLLVSQNAVAGGDYSVIYKLDGISSSEGTAGTVTYSEGKITVVPTDGNYLTLKDLTVFKTINGQHAQSREKAPGYDNTPLTLTALDASADPSKQTQYTFDIPGTEYDYEITANFHSRISIANANITLAKREFTYDGSEFKPNVTKVQLADGTELTSNDYTVTYENNINVPATANSPQPTIIVTGAGKYTGKVSTTFIIKKGTASVTKAPTAKEKLTYTGKAQELINAGECTTGNMLYKVGTDGNYSADIPTGTDAKTYTVYYKDAGNSNYDESAEGGPITVTIDRAKGTGYALWVGDTQVTDENADDILKDATTGKTKKSGSFVFNPRNNYLFINYEGKDGEEDLTIESRLPKLVIYIRNEVVNKLKRIFYNNIDDAEGTKPGKLAFTTYYNSKPGKLFLANKEGESAISGFSSVKFESDLAMIEPDGVLYNNQQLEWTKDVGGVDVTSSANEVTIARPLEMTKKVKVKLSDYVQRDDEGQPMTNEDGSPKIVSLRNMIINNLLHVLANSDNPDSDEGFDNSDGVDGITIEGLMTDQKVGIIAGKVLNSDLVPGGSALEEEYNGLMFLPNAGVGQISTTLKVDPGYAFHLALEKDIKYEKDEDDKYIISGDPFVEVHELSGQANPARGKVKKIEYKDAGNGYVEVTIDYDSDEPTYCYLYLVKTSDASGARNIVPVGKRDKVHGKVTSINVNIVKKSPGNPPYIASDGVIPNMEDPDDDDDVVTGIKDITNTNKNRIDNNKWYNLNGQQMNAPTKQGLYIINGKKIVIK